MTTNHEDLAATTKAMREQLGDDRPKRGSILDLWFRTGDALESTLARLREAEAARNEFHDKALDAIHEKNRAQDALRAAEAVIEEVVDELKRLDEACVAVPSKKFLLDALATYKPTNENGGDPRESVNQIWQTTTENGSRDDG